MRKHFVYYIKIRVQRSIDSIISAYIAKTIVSFDTKRLIKILTKRSKMSNSCKKETANRSMRQVCYAQSCYDLFTTACRNSVSNSTVAALSHQFVADLFPTALLQFCQNSFVADLTTDCSSHVTTGRNMPRERI